MPLAYSSRNPDEDEATWLRRELEKAHAALEQREKTIGEQVASAVRDAVDHERQRLAQALHQTASQTLTAAYLFAIVLGRKLTPDCPENAADAANLSEMIHGVIGELRELTQSFEPTQAERSPSAPRESPSVATSLAGRDLRADTTER